MVAAEHVDRRVADQVRVTLAGGLRQRAGPRRVAEHPALDETVRVRALLAWSSLYGTISFELFGHFVGSVEDGDRYFDRAMGELAGLIGLGRA